MGSAFRIVPIGNVISLGFSGIFEDEEGAKGTLEGSCTRMCPEAEQDFRQRMRDIDSFERIEEGGPPVLAVKKFARNVRISTYLDLFILRRPVSKPSFQ